jgi:hypothetical protein
VLRGFGELSRVGWSVPGPTVDTSSPGDRYPSPTLAVLAIDRLSAQSPAPLQWLSLAAYLSPEPISLTMSAPVQRPGLGL